ncbi:endonuclease/exonuclease/phosphatase family protein [Myxococcota bacterium]|nr:endonuclease/exonuclease/phosphatase family protein [Myxococcota bacterium]
MSNRILLILLWLLTACDPFHTQFDDVEKAHNYRAHELTPVATSTDPLKIVTWNIKYGGGRILFFWECGGSVGNMTKAEVVHNLEGLADKIRELSPDILLLQEADVQSKRSAYVDQVQYLLDHTHLNYGVYASAWKADFIPSDGIGRMDSGNAILSRWPLSNSERIALPLIGNYSFIEKYFYLKRNILKTEVLHPSRTFAVVNVHTEAFAEDSTKLDHLARFAQVLAEVSAAGMPFVAGGDLNSIPPGSPQVADFPDDNCGDARFEGDDYTGEEDWLDPLYTQFHSAIPLSDFQAIPGSFFSFVGSDGDLPWNRCLDYLFSNHPWVTGSGYVHQIATTPSLDPLMLSDHAPVVASWEVPQ